MNPTDSDHPSVKYWESPSLKDLLIRLIGFDFGPDPVKNEKAIMQDKMKCAQSIMADLQISPDHIGAEIGSGCGFLTGPAAHASHQMYALDISDSFLNYARKVCANYTNIAFFKIKPGSLKPVEDLSLDFIFSHNVFIHLNFFEIYTYLLEAKRVLKPGGRLWFDFTDLDQTQFLEHPDFAMSLKFRSDDPYHRGCIEFNSLQAVSRALNILGFDLLKVGFGARANAQVLAIKR